MHRGTMFDRIRNAVVVCVFASAAGAVAGCGHAPPVRAWQREHLTKRALRFDDGMETRFRQHLFSSREGADGGFGQLGGGCGCN